jgi:hypothetical protein
VRRRLALVALTTAAAGLWPATAPAATLPAACAGSTGDVTSLKAAIDQANAAPGPDVVELGQNCTYTIEQAHFGGGWHGADGLPAIASDITVEGNGATIVRDPTSRAFRFFFIGADPADPDTLDYVTPGPGRLTLRDLTLSRGRAQGGSSNGGGGGAGMGGAIFNQGTLIIERSTLVGNSAEGGSGADLSAGSGGGGMAPGPSNSGNGGGGTSVDGLPGGTGGAGGKGGGGGGAGLRTGQDGTAATDTLSGDGGGERTGTGGIGGGITTAASGDGSGGGGTAGDLSTNDGGAGGRFGAGGHGSTRDGGGGGGAGGGGGQGSPGSGGGGGFGGGGGWGLTDGGDGGFGGGAGYGANGPEEAAPGFGGGNSGTSAPGRGGGGAGLGGAVFNMQGSLTIRNSTLVGNWAIGGAPRDLPNPAGGMGGAVFNMSGSFTAVGSTFAVNSADARGASIYNLVYDGQENRTAQTTLQNTIVARGSAAPDVVSDETDYNLPVDRGTADVGVGDRNLVQAAEGREDGTITGTALTGDPLLGPLYPNGGPTETMRPRGGSAALDAGSAFGLITDQRGLSRPSDLISAANFDDAADIGAVELPAFFDGGTGVTIRLARRRIGRRGPVPIIVANANPFAIDGELFGRSVRRFRARTSARRRRVTLRPVSLQVPPSGQSTVRVALPRQLRAALRRNRKVALRLTAVVKDPSRNSRTVQKTVTPRLKKRR